MLLPVVMLSSTTTPIEYQLSMWRGTVVQAILPAFLIYHASMKHRKAIHPFIYALCVSMVIAQLYGVYLSRLGGINPYTTFLSIAMNATDVTSIYAEFSPRFAISTASKIQSTMFHPMTWCLHLVLFLCLILLAKDKLPRRLRFALIAMTILSIILSGVRTGIVASVIALTYLYTVTNFERRSIWKLAILMCMVVILVVSPVISQFVQDLFSLDTDSSGSTLGMRITQLQGAISEISGNPIFGKGFAWTSYYNSFSGDHPVMLAFESLALVILCNTGWYGVGIFTALSVLIFRTNTTIAKDAVGAAKLNAIFIAYLVYALGTGEYGYFQIFSYYYFFAIAFAHTSRNEVQL